MGPCTYTMDKKKVQNSLPEHLELPVKGHVLGVHLPAVEDVYQRVAGVTLGVGVGLGCVASQHEAQEGRHVAEDDAGGHQGKELGLHEAQGNLN